MSVRVSTDGTVSAVRRITDATRFSSGTPVVSCGQDSDNDRVILKGNGTTPTVFITEIGTAHNTLASRRVYGLTSATLLGNLMPEASGMNTVLTLYEVNEANTVNTTDTVYTYVSLPTNNTILTDFAVDSNGDIHVILTDLVANMGTNYITLYYLNNIGGSWNAVVEVGGRSNNLDCNANAGIQIDSDDLPFIKFREGTSEYTAIGNATNATSFTRRAVTAGALGWFALTLGVASDGDHYCVGRLSTNGDLYVWRHGYGDAWSVEAETIFSNKEYDTILGVRLVGDFMYVFFKDNTNNASGISVAKIDISGTTPTMDSVDESTLTDDWHESFGGAFKTNSINLSYDSSGTSQGVGSGWTSLDICYNVYDGAAEYEPYWENYSIVAAANDVSKIKVSSWKDWAGAQINIGGTWKTVTAVKINIGGVWKDVDITP